MQNDKIQSLHSTIKAKLQKRSTSELILDATVARCKKADNAARMVFALIMDTLSTRVTAQEFEVLYEEITAQ